MAYEISGEQRGFESHSIYVVHNRMPGINSERGHGSLQKKTVVLLYENVGGSAGQVNLHLINVETGF
jgi:hypothetical protein